ncbi:MAG: YkgJ family cysteine cluster protein [Proteobacteria bacterium]|nr:YkgJ family cysteine cluster protein [Pseudomonadota bacterium]
MSVEPELISIDDSFMFSCNSGLDCFNMCCKDVNQFLYPYDIIRLKTNLNLGSEEFLDTYTIIYAGGTTGLPVVSFKTHPANGHTCPFVGENGCRVYPDRPSSCRIFPLARAISRSRETGEIKEHFALIKDPICKGFQENSTMTVRQFSSDQDLAVYNENNDTMIELISLKQQIMPGPLDPASKEKFVLACYNIDRFRSAIFNDQLIEKHQINPELYERIKTDDVALLGLGFSWIKSELFGGKPSF